MNVFDLMAVLSLDTSKYEQGLNDASESASGFGSKLSKAVKVGATAVAATTAAVGALTGTVVAATGKTAEYGDNIDKMSQKMGMSAQAYQEWDAIMQHSGTSMETMKAGMKTLANAVENGNDAFERLGITQEQIASMSQEDLFAATISSLQNVENETERTYLAGQLLGRGATELGALLNTSAEDTEAMRQRVHELGGVMSDEAVKAAARYQDSLQDMQTAFTGLSRNMTAEFLPSVTTVMDGLQELFSGGDGLGKINEGINQFVSQLSAVLPRVMDTGSQIIVSLGKAIVQNLPVLVQSATSTIMTLAEGLISNLPLLVESALQIIITLANGISQSLPELMPTIVDVVLQIVDTLIDNADMLIEASLQIIIALADGLIRSLPKLLEKAPQIIWSLVKAIIGAVGQLFSASTQIISTLAQGIANGFGQLLNKGREIVNAVGDGIKGAVSAAVSWGRDLIQNFLDGITQKWQALKDKVSNVASTVKSFLGFSEPEQGPLSDFHTYAPDMMDLFIKGIKDNEKRLQDQVASTFDFGRFTVASATDASAYSGATARAASGLSIYGDVHISVDGTGKNAEQIARNMYKILLRQGVTAYA